MRIGIVGCGKMGTWFSQNLPHEVSVYDSHADRIKMPRNVRIFGSMEELLGHSDFLIVCVPIWENGRVLEEIKEKVHSGMHVCDIASLKEESVRILLDFPKSVCVSSIHPMFGPHGEGFENKKIIIVPPRGREGESEFFRDFFEGLGSEVILSDAETHDSLMALTLSLPHFFGYLFHCLISGNDIHELKRFGGTSFDEMLSFSELVFNEDKRFYFELMQNESFRKVMKEFCADAQGLIDAINRNDFKGFMGLLSKSNVLL